jgi:hypothetical protein
VACHGRPLKEEEEEEEEEKEKEEKSGVVPRIKAACCLLCHAG